MTKWLDRYTVRAPHMCLCLSQGEYEIAARQLDEEADPGYWLKDTSAACVHVYTNGGRLSCIVCIRPEEDGIAICELLVHESVHIKQALMQSIGEYEPSKEFEAYTVQAIFSELAYEYQRRRKE